MRSIIMGIIALALFVAPTPAIVNDAHANGVVDTQPQKKNFYFHGMGAATKIRHPHYAKLTMKYDGKTVVTNKRIDDNQSFGGVTTGKCRLDGNVYVKVAVYGENGLLKQRSWTKKLKNGTTNFELRGDDMVWAFFMHLDRSGTDVTVRIE